LAFVKTSVLEHAQNAAQISLVNYETTLNWLTPWSRVLVEKLIFAQIVKKFP
jgi:hypothetical protein